MEAKIRIIWRRRKGPGFRAAAALILPVRDSDIRCNKGKATLTFAFKGTEMVATPRPKNRLVPFEKAQEIGLDVKNARLELRWEKTPQDREWPWMCHYELLIPLLTAGEIRATLGGTNVGSSRSSMVYEDGTIDTPFRDGAHAKWDSEILGGLPVNVVCGDKTMKLYDRAVDLVKVQKEGP